MGHRYLVSGVLSAILLVGCGTSTVRASSATSTTSRGAQLPSPCSLLTTGEMRPLFGTTHIDVRLTEGPASGTAQCGYSRVAGNNVDLLSIWTRNDYARDSSYLFPIGGKVVAGIGDLAVLSPSESRTGTMTVKLGKDVLEIDVVSVTQPNDDPMLVHLAKDAVTRSELVTTR
jgi:hypothetical protein